MKFIKVEQPSHLTMDAVTTYSIFVKKTYKEKKYFWTRNLFFTVLPLLFFLLYFVLIGGSDTISTNSYGNLNRNAVLQKVRAYALSAFLHSSHVVNRIDIY